MRPASSLFQSDLRCMGSSDSGVLREIVIFEIPCLLYRISWGRAFRGSAAYLLFFQIYVGGFASIPSPAGAPGHTGLTAVPLCDLGPIRAMSSTAVRPPSADFEPPVRAICRMAASARFESMSKSWRVARILESGQVMSAGDSRFLCRSLSPAWCIPVHRWVFT